MNDSYIQVRTNARDKKEAGEVLETLGTNLSSVINMLLKQIILTKSIPFEISIKEDTCQISPYRVDNVAGMLDFVPESVDEVWIYGNSVADHFSPDPLLNVCLVGNPSPEEISRMIEGAKCQVDVISEAPFVFVASHSVPGSIYKVIKETGLLVYKKRSNISWK